MTEEEFNVRMEHCFAVKRERSLMSHWSIYEVDDLEADHPYDQAETVRYFVDPTWFKPGGHIEVPITGKKWMDLWLAAEEAIKKSGDYSHIFIEVLEAEGEAGKALRLWCGS